jgi:FkbM family methyltransferase
MFVSNQLSWKRKYPRFHQSLKRVFGPWLRGEVGFALPRCLGKRIAWTQPRLAFAEASESHIIRWVNDHLSVGNTFFDVGAHCGWMSMAAAYRVGSTGSAVAFEPSPPLVTILSYHKKVNRLAQMEIVPFAVSDADSLSTPFYLVNGGLSCRNSLTIGPSDTPHLTPLEKTLRPTRTITLDRYVLDSGRIPDLIKIDVEGGELLVLQGAEKLLSQHHPRLILGVHPFWLPRTQSVRQICALLDRHGYRTEEEVKVEFAGGYIADYLCSV